eukprot:gene13878-13993_t
MPDLTLYFFMVAIPAAILVGLSKGGLPVVGMLGVPLMSLVIPPVESAALLLPIYVITDMFGLYAYRHAFDKNNLLLLIPAGILGVVIGWATSSLVSEHAVTMLVGFIGIAFCVNNFLRRNHPLKAKPPHFLKGLFWGTVSGFTSFVSHSGGPPYQVYVLPQRLEKMVYAGTTTIMFAVVNAVKLIPYWALGTLTTGNLKTAALLMPIAVIATILGVRAVRVIPERPFFILVQAALFIISVKLVYDAAHGLHWF